MTEDCGICRDAITDATQIKGCGHTFCFACISQWCNVSNSCPLCQRRFLELYRLAPTETGKSATGQSVKVKATDKREANWMQVMEEYDSEEHSIHTSDDEDEENMGSEGDRYEPDFVLPDNVVVYEDGKIVDLRNSFDCMNPFGKAPRGQLNSTITTEDGQVISISWTTSFHTEQEGDAPQEDNSEDMEESDGEFHEPPVEEESSDEMSLDNNEEESDEPLPEGANVLYQGRNPRTSARRRPFC